MFDNLYREELLEHYRSPLNFGKLSNADSSAKQANPFCGDSIEMFVKFEKSRGDQASTLRRCMFIGEGCAISTAAASMLTEHAKGKTKKELTSFKDSDMLALLGIEVSDTRKKCALLALSVLRDCLYGTKSKS